MSHDDDLRALLEEAVSDVDPAPSLGAISSRTARASRRRWVLPTMASGVVVAAAVAGFLVVGRPALSQGPVVGAAAASSAGTPDPGPVSRPQVSGAAVASVAVVTPADGETVTSPFTVRGTAVTFEGTLTWELRPSGGGRTITGFTTAAECCTSSPYSFTVAAPPGDYTLVITDEDQSDGEGTSSEVSRAVTVR